MTSSTSISDVEGHLASTSIDEDNYGLSDSETEEEAVKPTGWAPWGFRKLKRLVAKAKGAASDRVVAFIKSHLRGTKVIFVIGQAGTGKSTMLKEMTGLDLKVGETLDSGTRQYEICPAVIDGEQYLFVDTAGFGAADMDDMDNFQNILSCLTILHPFVKFAGVLFVFGKPGTRLSREDLRTIRFIKCFCGPEFFANITLITSQWDEMTETGFRKAWGRTQNLLAHPDVMQILDPPGRISGGSVYHHGFPKGEGSINAHATILSMDDNGPERGDELRDLIRRKYRDPRAPTLQVLVEMKREGREMLETEAAKVLKGELPSTAVRIQGGRALIQGRNDDEQSPPTPGADPRAGHSSTQSGAALPSVPAAEGAPNTTGNAPGHGDGPDREQMHDEPSWIQKLLWWFKMAYGASTYFEEARKTGYESTNRKARSAGPKWSFWETVRNWWTSTGL
ncbi:hypothetical protein SAPIO_CDS3279 [Scedosporium apiospermum]|uniref:G domain-containing protein n=1 Tax=Pseudallescheria apiosperma TaxID=563466 RepID=A0A084GAF1_PSEDA|nr:uncharacterized protein SAPIO_CDS3279 [Scedosporium apiospermum]KEZ44313.1 hypothetical protein SAPIO_CDS3279 [Scedosporium apiospermum]